MMVYSNSASPFPDVRRLEIRLGKQPFMEQGVFILFMFPELSVAYVYVCARC
jgi:hypothetical protein